VSLFTIRIAAKLTTLLSPNRCLPSQPWLVCLFVLLISCVAANRATKAQEAAQKPETETALDRYVAAKDDSYQWKLRRQGKVDKSKYAELILTSQTWQEVTWKHQLFILLPETIDESKHALLFITGGRWTDEIEAAPVDAALPRDANRFIEIANHLRTPVAVLLQVPFQPMFGDRVEDDLIAHTFENFIREKDDTWPLLLPMVKTAVRAMDATTECCLSEFKTPIESFTVSGASKRGWTTWLSGAVDKRAKAIAPMVIDVLNMAEQMKHQKESLGGYSEQIEDYTDRGLQDLMATDAGKELRSIVDPYSYRDRISQPKLMMLGTNDRYWSQDALNLYWNDLQDDKYVLYVPNNGHGLNDYGRIIGTLAAFHEHAKGEKHLPQMDWTYETKEGHVELTVNTNQPVTKYQVWTTANDSRDFRECRWESSPMRRSGDDQFVCRIQLPSSGYSVLFGELVFEREELPCFLSTTLRILSPTGIVESGSWTDLFDGKTLNGWKMAEHGKADYSVKDGTILGKTVEGSPNSFLMSEQEFGDFELEFEVKVDNDLNSGVQIRSRGKTESDVAAEGATTGTKPTGEAGLGRFHGPQVEIARSPGYAGYIYGEATPYGWLSEEPKDGQHEHEFFKNEDWNKYRIVAKGNRIQTWINDHPVADLSHDGIFKSHPRGHIGLQVHGIESGTGPFEVQWRNIRIRELK
jgi:PhoPQ-activated pathogenicity-related protein